MLSVGLAIRSFSVGAAVAAVGALVLVAFARSFEDGATWSPVTQHGGPGFLFVVGPACVGWFWIASWVKRRGPGAFGVALCLSALAALAASAVGMVLSRIWPEHPRVLESLFSTIGVALIVSTIASVSVALVTEPNPE
ncbi:MAG: hypothetical protein ACKV2T_05860 [Kofleriaceae bacterium]